jgi:hypothetical protein
MPANLLDLLEGLFELADVLCYWRFWLPVLLAAAVAILIRQSVSEPVLRGVLVALVMTAGAVSGWVWHRKKG